MNFQKLRFRRLFLVALAALPFVIATAFFIVRPVIALDPDSITYLEWSPIRSSGYPLFLDVVEGPFLLHIQLFLFAAAVAWLALYVFRHFKSLRLAAILLVAVIVNPFVWLLQGTIMSEALSTPLLLLFLGCLIGFLASKKPALILIASLLAGIITATRPAGLPLIVAPVLAALLAGQRIRYSQLKLAGLCVCLWLVPVVGDRLYLRAVHGEQLTSLAGRHLFAKASLIDAPPLDTTGFSPLERRLVALAEVDFSSIRRVLEPLEGSSVHDVLRPNYEVCVQYACTNQAVSSLGVPEHELNRALFKVGFARLRQNPLEYAGLAWDEYVGLWAFHSRKHPGLADDYNRYVESAGVLPFQPILGPDVLMVPEAEQSSVFRISRPFFIFIGLTIAFITVGFGWLVLRGAREPFLLVSFISAVAVEATLIFNSLTGIGIPRYTMSIWPVIVCAILFAALFILEWAKARPGARSAAASSTPAGDVVRSPKN